MWIGQAFLLNSQSEIKRITQSNKQSVIFTEAQWLPSLFSPSSVSISATFPRLVPHPAPKRKLQAMMIPNQKKWASGEESSRGGRRLRPAVSFPVPNFNWGRHRFRLISISALGCRRRRRWPGDDKADLSLPNRLWSWQRYAISDNLCGKFQSWYSIIQKDCIMHEDPWDPG